MRRTSILRRRAITMALGALLLTGMAIGISPAAAGAAPKGAGGDAKAACKHGGWRDLVDDQGRPFRNQGQCVSAAVHNRVGRNLNAQVTGEFTGTTDFEFSTQGCSFVFQVFDANYTTASGGTGTFQIEGCVGDDFVDDGFSYTGAFVLVSPNGGTLTGDVTGTIDATGGALDFDLMATDATGSLAGAGGTVHLAGLWQFETGNTISGTLTGALSR